MFPGFNCLDLQVCLIPVRVIDTKKRRMKLPSVCGVTQDFPKFVWSGVGVPEKRNDPSVRTDCPEASLRGTDTMI